MERLLFLQPQSSISARVLELIETLWNVNIGQMFVNGEAALRINRNIVECKFGQWVVNLSTLWELIETLWNVNHFGQCTIGIGSPELIETLWNVNSAGIRRLL